MISALCEVFVEIGRKYDIFFVLRSAADIYTLVIKIQIDLIGMHSPYVYGIALGNHSSQVLESCDLGLFLSIGHGCAQYEHENYGHRKCGAQFYSELF